MINEICKSPLPKKTKEAIGSQLSGGAQRWISEQTAGESQNPGPHRLDNRLLRWIR
jgi:hypothetical protein